MPDTEVNKCYQAQKEAIEEVRAVLRESKKAFNEIVSDCTPASSESYEFEPTFYVKKQLGEIKITELNGFANDKRATRRLVKII